jgi:hypothetical protein
MKRSGAPARFELAAPVCESEREAILAKEEEVN